jgi:hypothetical protein
MHHGSLNSVGGVATEINAVNFVSPRVGLRVLISVSHSSYSSATYGMQDERVLPLQVSKRDRSRQRTSFIDASS